MQEESAMSLAEAEQVLSTLLTQLEDDDIGHTSNSSRGTAKGLAARLEKLEQQQEVEDQMSEEIETSSATETEADLKRRVTDTATPALRDATTALTRLDKTARRAALLAETVQRLAFIVGKHSSFKGEGPAYMNVAVKALREETRCYETAIQLAQLLTTQHGYRIEMVRDKSWAKDADEETVE
jgi:hypothetical protein